MQFSPSLRARAAAGEITVTFRLWSRRQVKVGGRYPVAGGLIEVDSIDLQPFASITEEDLVLAGEPDLATLRQRAAHAGPIHADTLVYRIEFHPVEEI